MSENVDFWKGLVTGTLVGMVFASYAKWNFGRISDFYTKAEASPVAASDGFRENTGGLNLRRESSESSGDPRKLSPARSGGATLRAVGIERPGGAPGRMVAAEILEVPGHPGQTLDHSDPAQPVHASVRALDLSGTVGTSPGD
jgi:hypothetical protein